LTLCAPTAPKRLSLLAGELCAELPALAIAREPACAPTAPSKRLTIVVPTLNERRNVTPLLRKLGVALEGLSWRVIFVDDNSRDGTARLVRRHAAYRPNIHCIQRIGRRGLSGAVVEGVLASPDHFVAVIDGDLQHDERLIPAMLVRLQVEEADVVIASRFLDAEASAKGLSPVRLAGSRIATALGRRVLKARVTDPLSGFFLIRRDVVEAVAPRLSTDGFKVLFDIIASSRHPLRIVEMSYRFGDRAGGRSKMDRRVVLDYLGLLASKLSHDLISPRILGFLLVGATGVLVHLGVLRGLLFIGFAEAQFVAAATAMTTNYALNNGLTYRDRRKTGVALLTGYLRFCLVCSLGLAGNVGVATLLSENGEIWWLAGLAGAAVGALWNYVASSLLVWR
jgi:dolichol-phosphate mannosyltransferase